MKEYKSKSGIQVLMMAIFFAANISFIVGVIGFFFVKSVAMGLWSNVIFVVLGLLFLFLDKKFEGWQEL